MSISSDVYITKKEAIKMVTSQLLHEQKQLIKRAVKGMDDWELTNILNDYNGEDYYYHIEDEGRDV